MERIVLEVDGALARAWRNTTPEVREMYEHKINDMLKELKEADFDKLLDRAGKTAEDNGLTEEKPAIINGDTTGKRYEWWNDEEMMAELEQISADMKSGKDKGIPWEELRDQLLNRAKMK
jgi:hypothetical protein